MARFRIGALILLAVTLMSVLLTASVASASSPARATPRQGGSLTVATIGTQWPSLDPATDLQGPADTSLMNAVFGQLFEQGAKGLIPSLATSYSFANSGMTLRVLLRKGVTFQDGTPFNGQAVASSMERDLLPANACICLLYIAPYVASITATGTYEVDLALKAPYAPLVQAFLQSAMNWTVSPTALAHDGLVAFSQHPVGAGPFEVVSNVPSSTITLKKFPGYWQKGKPLLSELKFVSVASADSAYSALQSGQVQMIAGALTPSTFLQARKAGQVKSIGGNAPLWIAVNTASSPFNDIRAREALYYALDPKVLLEKVGLGAGTVSQSPSGPTSDVYEQYVPGYRTYNPTKARALVKQLGGLTFTLFNDSTSNTVLAEAIFSEMSAVGITMHITNVTLAQQLQSQMGGHWQATIQNAGGPDPAAGVFGLKFEWGSQSTISGVHDSTLDSLISSAVATTNAATKKSRYDAVYKYMSDKAYGPFMYSTSLYVVKEPSVKIPYLGSAMGGPAVNWETLSMSS